MKLALLGVVIGLITSFAMTRLMSSLPFNLGSADPLTFAVIPLILTGVALAACFVPALRAAEVDLMVALRRE
jgi:ABC-type antimicrobial peptide transport system permease subunit